MKRISLKWIFLLSLNFYFGTAFNQKLQNEFIRLQDPNLVKAQFLSPPNEYAPHAFWFWNDSLNSRQSAYMAREMIKKGMSPGYIHPRHINQAEGLPPDQWLSEQYFKDFKEVLEISDSAGMYVGFCDDYWWPSGRIGGRMINEHPEMQAKDLKWEKWELWGPRKVYLPPNNFIVACQEIKQGLIDTESLQVIAEGKTGEWLVPEGKWSLFIFTLRPSPSSDRGTDFLYVNFMEPKLLEYTIEMGLKPYEEHLGEYMGKSLRYCFADTEGDYGNRLPWSDYLITLYENMYGSDIRKWMPLLLTEDSGGKWVVARHNWFNMVSEMYAHGFWKPINDWLAERGLYYVPNFWEANLSLQAAAVGDFFRANRAFSFLGNDALGLNAYEEIHFKEIQSISEFEKRPFLSEIMGVQGWEHLPTEMKEVVNLTTAWGVTQVVPHGMNMDRELPNLIHPADWFEQNPYWQTISKWNEFAKRSSFINGQGKLVSEVLIYNPITSIWSLSDNYLAGRSPGGREANWNNPLAAAINQTYFGIQIALTSRNIEYLIADDVYMLDSNINSKTKKLKIKHHEFSTLFLPPLHTVATEVYQRIIEFAQSGGKVVALGQLPVASAELGYNDENILKLNDQLRSCASFTQLKNDGQNIKLLCEMGAMEAEAEIQFEAGDFKLYSSHRIIGENHYYWLANNTGKHQSAALLLNKGRGRAEKWNCETGEIVPLNYGVSGNKNRIKLDFGPYEGFWLVFDARGKNRKIAETSSKHISLPDKNWLVRVDATQVPVTTAYVFPEDKPIFKSPMDIPENEWVFQSILNPLHIKGNWNTDWLLTSVSTGFAFLNYSFNLKESPEYALLSITAEGGLNMYINGVECKELKFRENWRQVDVLAITPYLKQGLNKISVRSDKYVGAGSHWLIAQGYVCLPGGDTLILKTGSDWLKSGVLVEGWNITDSKPAGFTPASVETWDRLGWTRKNEVHMPLVKMIDSDHYVWLKFNVPPGSTAFIPEVELKDAQVWINGSQSPVNYTNQIPLNDNARQIVIRIQRKNMEQWEKPGMFLCGNQVNRMPEDWFDWGLSRYTGFLEYELVFDNKEELLHNQKAILDLGNLQHVAEVRLNGLKVGGKMWPPFEFDITGQLAKGENRLLVRVGNIMANEMAVYDDQFQLRRWGNIGIPGLHYFRAGMKGPCSIRIEQTK